MNGYYKKNFAGTCYHWSNKLGSHWAVPIRPGCCNFWRSSRCTIKSGIYTSRHKRIIVPGHAVCADGRRRQRRFYPYWQGKLRYGVWGRNGVFRRRKKGKRIVIRPVFLDVLLRSIKNKKPGNPALLVFILT